MSTTNGESPTVTIVGLPLLRLASRPFRADRWAVPPPSWYYTPYKEMRDMVYDLRKKNAKMPYLP
ncbi:MAG: hypothetical protein Q4C70_07820 [Planctomycetia bacterium]|nr:hypothetical protein [Planctomycetia bacterium]